MKTTLLIMAAGIGSRFGTGIKQLVTVDSSNHCDQAFYLRKKRALFLLCSKSKDSGVSPGWVRILFVILFLLFANI